jgi:hypothetical protein
MSVEDLLHSRWAELEKEEAPLLEKWEAGQWFIVEDE